ncbi:MAG: ribonuclease P protein component [Candidatus Nealsonbacteria bacterium]|nr:ribonuclease P protein component [Candidatus Nealsonbacteria bacterium]
MLSRIYRLKKEADIRRVFRDGKTLKDPPLSLRRAPNNLECSRFGFVIPVKAAKKATVRNKIKRRMSEMIRSRLPKIKKGFDVLILAFSGTDKLDFPALEKKIDNLFQGARLYENA